MRKAERKTARNIIAHHVSYWQWKYRVLLGR
jgi:hypothetical protein